MTSAKKPRAPRGRRIVTRGKVRGTDLLWNTRGRWSLARRVQAFDKGWLVYVDDAHAVARPIRRPGKGCGR